MSSEEAERESFDLTDPKAMRALAHPVRMALLELLRAHQTLTATQASEALGETPANCAFHLRTLAKYGFAQEAGGGRGRERPWRAGATQIRLRSEQSDPQAAIAAQALGEMFRERWFERARRAYSGPKLPGWDRHATVSQCFLTPEELNEIADAVSGIISRHDDRVDPALRPAGAKPVDLMFFGYPIQE
jgi:DNA-binding transcriptional ArsR family regulator